MEEEGEGEGAGGGEEEARVGWGEGVAEAGAGPLRHQVASVRSWVLGMLFTRGPGGRSRAGVGRGAGAMVGGSGRCGP
jgi:hypothetical protein